MARLTLSMKTCSYTRLQIQIEQLYPTWYRGFLCLIIQGQKPDMCGTASAIVNSAWQAVAVGRFVAPINRAAQDWTAALQYLQRAATSSSYLNMVHDRLYIAALCSQCHSVFMSVMRRLCVCTANAVN